MDGFSIEKASYQQPDYRGLNTGKREKNSIENQIAHLINGVKTKIDDIGSLTDSAFGRIFLTESKVIDIHHGNLLITQNNNELEHIMHFDQTIKSTVSSTNDHNLWKIGNYVQDG